MAHVKFPLEKIEDTNLIKYPDSIELFSNTYQLDETTMVGDYYGVMQFEEYIEPPKPIQGVDQIDMAQAKLVLLQDGLLDAVDAYVASADKATQIEWGYRKSVKIDNPLVQSVKTALTWTDEQLQDMFNRASIL